MDEFIDQHARDREAFESESGCRAIDIAIYLGCDKCGRRLTDGADNFTDSLATAMSTGHEPRAFCGPCADETYGAI
jgi:hypothetical protein